MSYTLQIGEYQPNIQDGIEMPGVIKMELPNAPADGSPTDYTNERWPSYSAWHEFMVATGLHPLFNSRNGQLMNKNNHPGYAIITKQHQRIIHVAYTKINSLPMEHRGRLEWLKFWVDWALDNCKKPVFVNW